MLVLKSKVSIRAASMESYLKYTLGLHVSIRTWNDSNTLPDELKREKEYSLLEICGITCLIITVREVDFQLSVFERKCEELQISFRLML